MLDARLEMIYGLLPDGVMCDIGTDHCKLAAEAVLRGKAPRAVATDLRPGPLAAAKRTVDAAGISDQVTLLLSDGFADIPDSVFDHVDCFVIAGMGGELIESILQKRHTDRPLVLQPMSAVYELCMFLSDGYDIQKRVFCRDGDKLYTALLCRYDGVKRAYAPFCGSVRDGAFYDYLERELARVTVALSGMRRGVCADQNRIAQLERLKQQIITEKNR